MTSSITLDESVTETQSVRFLIDEAADFGPLRELDLKQYQKAIILCDETLCKLWWPLLSKALENNIRIAATDFLSAAEETKHLRSFVKLVDRLSELRCTKDDLLIAIGGGTILDVAAFLASTYMRGVSLLMIPTTLIGQADASTAGKTCINSDYAKNLLGTLYFPFLVYNNVRILKTNSAYDLRQGFSEIFKYALLGSQSLLEQIQAFKERPDDRLMMEILRETIAVRIAIRKKDPLASNLGHTFGHALEKYTRYGVNHGDAIAVGTVMALEFSTEQGIIPSSLKERIVTLMESLGLNTRVETNIDPNKLTEIMLTDKKSSNTKIRLVLIREIAQPLETDGRPFYPVEPDVMRQFIGRFLKNDRYIQQDHWRKLKEST